MKIAIIGTRGVPARYGGFETCAEELGRRLVARGHEVSVYCRKAYYSQKISSYKGMQLIFVRGIERKSLDTLSHTFLSFLHASFRPYDALLVFNAANGPLLVGPKLARKKVVLNLDGLEWKRGKWNSVAKVYYRLATWISLRLADALISDSRAVQDFYRRKLKKETVYIPYGATIEKIGQARILSKYNLEPRKYFLQVTRFEPENNPLLTVKALTSLSTDRKLVLVGGAKYLSSYSRALLATRDERIIFPGFIYDRQIIRELLANCLAYIHGNEAGGTNPALLEAMAAGAMVLALDVEFNREVLREAGVYFKKEVNDLRQKMKWAIENEANLDSFQRRAQEIVAADYRWDDVVSQYERILLRVAKRETREAHPGLSQRGQ